MTDIELLKWLSTESSSGEVVLPLEDGIGSALGECQGELLDGLLRGGLARISPPQASASYSGFERVHLTAAGWAKLQEEKVAP